MDKWTNEKWANEIWIKILSMVKTELHTETLNEVKNFYTSRSAAEWNEFSKNLWAIYSDFAYCGFSVGYEEGLKKNY